MALYPAVYPPSTQIMAPVKKSEAFEDRKITIPIKSSGSPNLPIGIRFRKFL